MKSAKPQLLESNQKYAVSATRGLSIDTMKTNGFSLMTLNFVVSWELLSSLLNDQHCW